MSTEPKEVYIERLFSSIAPRYDLLNSILSLNFHRYWRRFAVRKCALRAGDCAVDVGSGTLDFAIELSRAVGPSGSVLGVDFCRPMLDIGRRKLARRGISGIRLVQGNAEHLPLRSNSYRAATIGFVLRNVESVGNALAEMTRVVEPGGRVVALELARPVNPAFRATYDLYFHRLLPIIGGAVNGRMEPYQYLPASVARFHSREELLQIMHDVGLADAEVFNLTGGIVTVHVGIKK